MASMTLKSRYHTHSIGQRRSSVVLRVAAPARVPAATAAPHKVPSVINGVIFRQLFDDASSTYSYIVADPVTRDALLIDPVYEQAERDLQILDELGVALVEVTNTHCHADHITGSGKLKALRAGVRSSIAAASGAAADVQLQHNDVIRIGSLKLICLSTPGHTNGCMCFYLPPSEAGATGMVFTGDALLIRACGRTDFQQGNAGTLYDMIHAHLFSLPDDTIVWPGHDYQGRSASSIAEEKAFNPRLTKSREEFIQIMDNLNLPHPKQIARALPANLKDGAEFPYA